MVDKGRGRVEIIEIGREKTLIIDYRGQIIQLRIFSETHHGQVRFGIEAPLGVLVNREEIYEIIQAQKKAKALCAELS